MRKFQFEVDGRDLVLLFDTYQLAILFIFKDEYNKLVQSSLHMHFNG